MFLILCCNMMILLRCESHYRVTGTLVTYNEIALEYLWNRLPTHHQYCPHCNATWLTAFKDLSVNWFTTCCSFTNVADQCFRRISFALAWGKLRIMQGDILSAKGFNSFIVCKDLSIQFPVFPVHQCQLDSFDPSCLLEYPYFLQQI